VVTLRLPIVAALALALALAPAGSGRGEAAQSPADHGVKLASPTPVPATAITAGLNHSCALIRAGGVKCWGSNDHAQLGDAFKWSHRLTPNDVAGLSGGVTAIAAGVRHSCALTATGGAKCWGMNSEGTLGDGTTNKYWEPVDVSGLSSGVTAIAAGSDYSCAVTSTGGVKCWGYNRWGVLGDGTTTHRSTPVDVSGLTSGVTAVAAAFVHTCALTTSGGVKCWGGNGSGQLGDGTTTDRLTPVDVVGLSDVTAIAASCALTRTGGVKCWGRNNYGQLGDGTTRDSSTPVDVSGLTSGVTAIAGNSAHTCALISTGGVKCWGENDFGQLGDGTTGNRSTPVDASGLSSGVTAIAVGSFHSCAITRTGGSKCWGWNVNYQLGDGTTVTRLTPVTVVGLGTPKATLAIVSRTVRVTSARVAAIELRCGSQAACRGTLTLTTSVNGKLVGSSARRVQVKLGSRTFSLAAGRTQTVKVGLTARGLELLTRVKRLSARVRISYQQPTGGATTATRTITLSTP
jgi:alpha-tubulin suppressor-like RCC1 family protein